jgi:hypothetical protein
MILRQAQDERLRQAQDERHELGLVLPPSTLCAGRCALCWESFRVGQAYTTVWPRSGVRLALTLHPACRAQLVPGDLGRLFRALEQRTALPLAVLGLRGNHGATWNG